MGTMNGEKEKLFPRNTVWLRQGMLPWKVQILAILGRIGAKSKTGDIFDNCKYMYVSGAASAVREPDTEEDVGNRNM